MLKSVEDNETVPKSAACSFPGCCTPLAEGQLGRREFLKLVGFSTALVMSARLPVMAGPFETSDFNKLVPADKKLHPEWVKSLFERGSRTLYHGDDLKYIGMPVGGIGTGQLYLGGDGKLWHWDIFNQYVGTGAEHYAKPVEPSSPLEQGFAIQITSGNTPQTHALDKSGFFDISFSGQYPIGTIEYKDAAVPLAVTLEAFSPFIPLATDDSSLPVTVLHFTVKNTSNQSVEATLAGWLQNAVLLHNPWQDGIRHNRILHEDSITYLHCGVDKPAAPTLPAQPDIVFEDWNKDSYAGWTVEGTAFGKRPLKKSEIPDYQGDVGGEGDRLVNSHASAPGATIEAKDAQTGKLISKYFVIERNFINFWIGGGSHAGKTCLNLIVDGKAVCTATGANDNRMALQTLNVRGLKGKDAFLEIVDAETVAWGNIGVGQITFSDHPARAGALEELSDYGTMGLALIGNPAEHALAAAEKGGFSGREGNDASTPLSETLIGAVGRRLHLNPGQTTTVDFLLTWHFPNFELQGLGKVGRYYATRFDSAHAVARYVLNNFQRLTTQTRLWRDTWYDSTLPYWFLDRTFLNTSILATSTCYRFANGRFYAWEGVGCCPGTCTHVWHYAHAMARIFPDLERDLRERVDFGLALNPESGVSGFRAEFDRSLAVDGQSGTLLRAYREHQMSRDSSFLRRNWAHIKKAYEPLLKLDKNDDGVLEGPQMNTLDTAWYGKVAWLSSLYIAALHAGAEMAQEMGESDFAARCRTIAERGAKNITEQLFNGEYFLNKPVPQHLDAINSGSGCEIDQVFGQSWAFQVHLGRVLPVPQTRTALQSLWKYNFSPDVGPYREVHKPGRWYAMAGEAGLLMCTFPRADWDYEKAKGKGPEWAAGYFNECMSGFEYQAAGHMIWEGLVLEGLAVTRAVHDRYHGSRRNPWNEVECGDHYARSMASYGVFLAACGYEYHGPQGYLSFAPRLQAENFKAAFTTAEGWGSFAQQVQDNRTQAEIALKWGQLQLKTLVLTLPPQTQHSRVRVTLNGRAIKITQAVNDNRLRLTLATPLEIHAGQTMQVTFNHAKA
ncbi:MAG: hypothetical protein JO316_04430 [Abitibacteriaceae bacterium]|nr:hypothetical protein [Abditibacteriaceae bacterium]MBV9864572.1 hypothetical protein [Abditibacteriaceae bacterium]